MYSNWMPQNIHKRLLLYILQQLSLFSAIDLPNLEEVSLNNIHLRDVSIDPEKLGQIPGLCLRHGNLRNVRLNGGVVDGVTFKIDGVDLVVAPTLDSADLNSDQLALSLSSEKSHVPFLLAKSSADLASTIFFEQTSETDPANLFLFNSKNPAGSDSLSSSSSSSSVVGAPNKQSPLSGVMGRAVEIALLRIKVNITDLKIKFILDPVDLDLLVEQISFRSINGIRKLSLKGIRLSTLNSNVKPGHTSHDLQEPEVDPSCSSDSVSSENDSDNDSSGYGDESLTDSMIFTHEQANSIYLSATSTILPSSKARSNSPRKSNSSIDSKNVDMVFIDDLEISFDGLSPLSDLSIDINVLNVAAVPLLPTSCIVSNTFAKMLKLKIHQILKQRASKLFRAHTPTGFPEYENCDDLLEDPESDIVKDVFDKLHVSKLEVSLTSALLSDGSFLSLNDDVSVVFSNFNLKRKDPSVTFGGIQVFKIVRFFDGESLDIFSFKLLESSDGQQSNSVDSELTCPSPSEKSTQEPSQSSRKAEIRFEYFQDSLDSANKKSSDFTVLLSNEALINLDSTSLMYLINFLLALSNFGDSFSGMIKQIARYKEVELTNNTKSRIPAQSEPPTSVIFQTASMIANLKLLETASLKAAIFPISYQSARYQFRIKRILLSLMADDKEHSLLSIVNIFLNLGSENFASYVSVPSSSVPRKVRKISSKNLNIGEISGSLKSVFFSRFLKDLSGCISEILSLSKMVNCIDSAFVQDSVKISSKPTMANTMTNSIYSNKNRLKRSNIASKPSVMFGDSKPSPVSFRVFVKLVKYSLLELSPGFGDLSLDLSHFDFYLDPPGFNGFINTFQIQREYGDLREPLISHSLHQTHNVPIALFGMKTIEKRSEIEVSMRQFLLDYHAEWASLLEGESGEKPVNDSKNNRENFPEIILNFHDFALGVKPLRLPSKLYITVGKGSLEITSTASQFYVKSSFSNIGLLLIDDIEFEFQGSLQEKERSFHRKLLSLGYTDIGSINTFHVGVTVTTNMEELLRRHQRNGSGGELSQIDLKINSDAHVLTLCADSTHVLLQTINDLKEPIVFDDDDKFRIKGDPGFTLPKDIMEEIENAKKTLKKTLKKPKHRNSQSDDFCVIGDDEMILASNISQLSQLELNENLKSRTAALKVDESLEASLNMVEGHFASKPKSKKLTVVPFLLLVNLSSTEIFLYDGFDWKLTRKSLRKAIKSVETRAVEAKKKQLSSRNDFEVVSDDKVSDEQSDESQDNISELIFQSIHISSKVDGEVADLVGKINSQIQPDEEQEQNDELQGSERKSKDLKLHRSRIHKVSTTLKGIEVAFTSFTNRNPKISPVPALIAEEGSEVVNNLELRIDSLTVFDNLPSSTWNKLLSYMSLVGEREIGTSMLHVNILNVRPDLSLPFTEAMFKVRVLPVRLYVDQDTLGFLNRFIQFKDSRFELPVDEMAYFQKFVVDPLRIKFDYKPKKIDYTGLRAGKSSELANFFILDGSDISLQRAAVYGAHGMPQVGEKLGMIYAPYIQKYQLLGLLSGVAPVRSIVNVGGGMKDLIAMPVREYKKDGRLIYGLRKGAKSFAKVATFELLNLGVKLASGAQVLLENLEEYFGGEGMAARRPSTDRRRSQGREESTPKRKANLLESSHILREAVAGGDGGYSGQLKYSSAVLDDEDDLDGDMPLQSILVFDPSKNELALLDESTEMDEREKMISLYSNQPVNSKEGLKSAYRSLGLNLQTTKKHLLNLKNELREAETFQDLITSIAKSSPVIVIRPLIGTTEAMMKTLMGLSNEIDPRLRYESQDKYQNSKRS